MFALVALLCFYAGSNNISKAVKYISAGTANSLTWFQAAMGVLLVVVGVACLFRANSELKEKRRRQEEKQKNEKEQRQRQFFYDEPAEDTQNENPGNTSASEDKNF